MSIINEALKKVQISRKPSEETVASPKTSPHPLGKELLSAQHSSPPVNAQAQELLPKKFLFHSRLLITLPILVLVLLLVQPFFKMLPFTPKPTKVNAGPAKIVVTGIMTMGNKKMALINGEIYEIGDMIEGMTLMGILPDSIQLLKDGKIQIHKVRK